MTDPTPEVNRRRLSPEEESAAAILRSKHDALGDDGWRAMNVLLDGLIRSPKSLKAVVWAEISGLEELARQLRSPTAATNSSIVAHEIEKRARRMRRALVAEGAES